MTTKITIFKGDQEVQFSGNLFDIAIPDKNVQVTSDKFIYVGAKVKFDNEPFEIEFLELRIDSGGQHLYLKISLKSF